MRTKYTHDNTAHNVRAAEKIVPFLLNYLSVNNVIDVGCGTGTWLKVFEQHKINITGIEGHHLNKKMLVIDEQHVILKDLEQPLHLNRKFDLAISLEVAEHLNISVSENFVHELVQLSDCILFSAAIPGQGGQNHINEQWLSYWHSIFKKHSYKPYDIIRPVFWDDEDVDFWYAQNCCLFVNANTDMSNIESLPTFLNKNIVHPEMYLKVAEYRKDMLKGNISFRHIAGLLQKKIKRK